MLGQPGTWSNQDLVKKLSKERSSLQDKIETFRELHQKAEDIEVFMELYEQDHSVLADIKNEISMLKALVDQLEVQMYLGQENDDKDAIIEIHAGAGGVDAQDWAEMLARMYFRWADRLQLTWQELDRTAGEEAGIKGITASVRGEHAYGLLKCEKGVHRLVRISPFDANARRHTSFASVDVTPDIEEDIEIEIRNEDLRIDTFRSSGHGGQHVNVTDSAVRITHIPTGIVVSCQNERSQHKNKAWALKILKIKLHQRELEMRQKEKEAQEAQKREIAWGSQIRSYVLQPYQMVKDHRTGLEIGNINAVLDGDLDMLITESLRKGLCR